MNDDEFETARSALEETGMYEFEDGKVLRIKVEPEETGIRAFWSEDCYGKIAEFDYDYLHDAHTPRPEGFDGKARKIQFDRGYWTWWQPPADLEEDKIEEAAKFARDLMERGFYQVGMELVEGEDAYGRGIVTQCEWLGGVDTLEDGYLGEIIDDMLHAMFPA